MTVWVILIGAPIAAFLLGWRLGRKRSAIAIGVCVLIVILASFVDHLLFATSDIEAVRQGLTWNIATGVGIGALLAAIALVGPALFKTWYSALPALGLIPWAYAYLVCVLFGVCI